MVNPGDSAGRGEFARGEGDVIGAVGVGDPATADLVVDEPEVLAAVDRHPVAARPVQAGPEVVSGLDLATVRQREPGPGSRIGNAVRGLDEVTVGARRAGEGCCTLMPVRMTWAGWPSTRRLLNAVPVDQASISTPCAVPLIPCSAPDVRQFSVRPGRAVGVHDVDSADGHVPAIELPHRVRDRAAFDRQRGRAVADPNVVDQRLARLQRRRWCCRSGCR